MTQIDELKNNGLKATLPRLKILDVFQSGAQRHMTAEDVFRHLLLENSDIGLGRTRNRGGADSVVLATLRRFSGSLGTLSGFSPVRSVPSSSFGQT